MDAGVSISECDPWSVRWLAPELLFPEEFGLESARRTKETDIYAFAMVIYEVGPLFVFPIGHGPHTSDYVTYTPQQVFSGSFPFQGIRNEALILPVRSGDHPRRPENSSALGLTNELWNVMKTCWNRRDLRLKISQIVLTLKSHSATAVEMTE